MDPKHNVEQTQGHAPTDQCSVVGYQLDVQEFAPQRREIKKRMGENKDSRKRLLTRDLAR